MIMLIKSKILLVIISIYLFSINLAGQTLENDSLPVGLTYEFNNRFPGVDKIKWKKTNDIYIANFNFMKQDVEAHFDINTRWIYASSSLAPNDLPRNIQRYISSLHSELSITEAFYIEKRRDPGFYKIKAKSDTAKRILYFDKEGLFSKMTDEQDNEIFVEMSRVESVFQKVSTRELPTLINSYTMINHPGFRIFDAYLVNNDTWKDTYYVILGSQFEAQRIELWFDHKGYLKKKIDPFEVKDVKKTVTEKKVDKEGYWLETSTKSKKELEKEAEKFFDVVDDSGLSLGSDYAKINPRELPTKIIEHIAFFYAEHKIEEAYIVTDDITNEFVYIIIIKKRDYKHRKKLTYTFIGEIIDEEDL